MTKTEFLRQGIDDLRTALLDIFEDPDGELVEMAKPQLIAFARENWNAIDDAINAAVEEPTVLEPAEDVVEPEASAEPVSQGEMDDTPLDLEPEPTLGESVATPDESEAPSQRVGTRNLA